MALFQDQTIYVCVHCGEFTTRGSKYCPDCRTKEGRDNVTKDTKRILALKEDASKN